jgi:tRNA (guanine37-N1)-methyltransferase
MGVDIVGSEEKMVAIVELEEGTEKKIEEVAAEIMNQNPGVKTVLQKFPGTKGSFRIKEYRLVAGVTDTEVIHKEYGFVIKLDPQKVYFSPRESTVRQHIASRVRPGDRVLVMFAGVGPCAIAISKAQPKVREVVAVELNPDAFRYMKDNIRMNKVAHLVSPILGDVRIVCANMREEFDKIVMPMVGASQFIDLATQCCKRGGLIQIYMLSSKENIFEDCKLELQEKLKNINREYEIEGERKIALYSPGKWKVLIEVRMK